ncbi:MAG: mechanosensitive ion channel domain-containing protein [Saprospiraceae bacterium]
MRLFFQLIKVIIIAGLILVNEYKAQWFGTTLADTHLITGLFGFLLFFLISETARDLLLYLYRKRKKLNARATDNVTIGLDNIYILILAGAIFYFVLHIMNLKPRDFFTGITLISAAIAIIMKDYISNIISGMILAFSDKLKIGDYVQVGQFRGEIIDFSLTSITLRNDDDETVYIPINTIFSHELTNFTNGEIDTITVDFELNNRMKIPFEVLKEKINAIILPYTINFIENSHDLFVSASKQESTIFKFKYTLKARDLNLARRIQADILKEVYENTSMLKQII